MSQMRPGHVDLAKFYWSVAGRDLDAVEAALAPDVLVHSPVRGVGKEVALDAAVRCFAPTADVPAQPEPCFVVHDGPTVVTCYSMPQARTDGTTYDFFWMDAVRLEGGLIVEWWPSINDAAPTQLSWTPPPSSRIPITDGTPASGEGMKQLAVDFYRYVFDSHDADAVPRYVNEDYRQHSRHLPSGRKGLQSLVAGMFPAGRRPTPDPMTLEPVLLAAEGDIVVHGVSLLQRTERQGTEKLYPYLVFDAYRVRDGKLAEHWSGVNAAAPPLHDGPSAVPAADEPEAT